ANRVACRCLLGGADDAVAVIEADGGGCAGVGAGVLAGGVGAAIGAVAGAVGDADGGGDRAVVEAGEVDAGGAVGEPADHHLVGAVGEGDGGGGVGVDAANRVACGCLLGGADDAVAVIEADGSGRAGIRRGVLAGGVGAAIGA